MIRRIASGSPYEPRVGYCRAVVVDGWIHVSGTTGQEHDGDHVPESVTDQCRLAIDHIGRALAEAGAGFADVVRVTYILPDRADFRPCWPILREAFGAHPPAATMMQAGLVDPALRIEIEVTARVTEAGAPRP